MRVNLRARDRDRAGPLVVRENQSRRDLTKVTQYEVLGNEAKNRSVPLALGTIACSAFDLARGSAIASIRRSSRPGRILFKKTNPALRTGLLSLSPSGTKVLTVQS